MSNNLDQNSIYSSRLGRLNKEYVRILLQKLFDVRN